MSDRWMLFTWVCLATSGSCAGTEAVSGRGWGCTWTGLLRRISSWTRHLEDFGSLWSAIEGIHRVAIGPITWHLQNRYETQTVVCRHKKISHGERDFLQVNRPKEPLGAHLYCRCLLAQIRRKFRYPQMPHPTMLVEIRSISSWNSTLK